MAQNGNGNGNGNGNNRAALFFKKLVTDGQREPPLGLLDEKYQSLAWLVATVGTDRSARAARLRAELLARGDLVFLEQVEQANPAAELETAESSDSWKFTTLGDAYKPLPELQQVVRGLIARPSISIFFGAPKSLKTLLVMDLCICVAGNKRWLPDRTGQGGFQVVTAPVVWLDFENGPRRMAERFSSMGKARNLPDSTPLFYTSMPSPWLDASETNQMGALINRIKPFGAGLVVVDHLSQVLGGVDENTSQVSEIMANLRNFAESLNLALILLHHQVKGANRFGISSSDALRGHGSILASCDLAAVIERQVLDKNAVNVRPVAIRGAGVDDFAAVFAFEQKQDGSSELESARFFGQGLETADAQIEKTIIDVLSETPGINQTMLRSLVAESVENAGDPKIRKAIARMEKDGRIKIKEGKQNSKTYTLGEVD